jgi:hypothetical protein
MRTITTALLSVCLLLLAAASDARGQASGSSRLGEALSVQSTSGAAQSLEDVGTVQGSERYLRKNRRPTDFVGSDAREARRYVGALQARARGTVTPITQGLTRRVDRAESMNQPLLPTRRGTAYHPRLEISFEATPTAAADLPSRRAPDTLVRSPRLSGPSRIAVLMAERTAILQGEVPSEEDRALAEILLSFEPGISAIQNELQVNPDLTESADSLSALRRQQTQQEAWTTLNPVSHSAARTSAAERSY